MDNKPTATFVELTIVESDILNAPIPRKGLVDVALIATLEDLGDRSPSQTRCSVTLHQPSDSTVSDDEGGEHVLRASRTLFVRESYGSLVALLEKQSTVLRVQ